MPSKAGTGWGAEGAFSPGLRRETWGTRRGTKVPGLRRETWGTQIVRVQR
jgi:hypothetical protein